MSQSHSTAGGVSPPMNAAVHRAAGQQGLTRYGSAPGSLLARAADSVIAGAGDGGFRTTIGSDGQMSRFFPRDSPCLASNSRFQAAASVGVASDEVEIQRSGGGGSSASVGLQQPFDLGVDSPVRDMASAAAVAGEARAGGSHLTRQHSSPAGFFSHLMVDSAGFAASRGTRSYFQPANESTNALTGRRLKSQLSFSRQDAVSQISEISIPEMGESSDEAGGNAGQSYVPSNYPISSWDETNSIVFSTSNKHSRDNGDIISSLNNIDSQYGLPGTSVDMSVVDKLLQIQQDSAPFKIRAKRGCATHPRSIAERERRTRISEKLRKLQEIVPNMDKQTSTADMLDLAVQHIKGLQSQIQILKQEQTSCTCVSNDEDSLV
ncbi:transcription factor bHLH128 isoform X1 [Dendrobium catenatum]|uniref:transcription factor bHLH128 isoform X1 n=1 Tax=Dendrobium catenatum TaxID=906689 RepID=UPI0009F70938|nr:transcription factor bHLH128 isoform X1 [Dendrobium catenatum]